MLVPSHRSDLPIALRFLLLVLIFVFFLLLGQVFLSEGQLA